METVADKIANTVEDDSLLKTDHPNWILFTIFWLIAALISYWLTEALRIETLHNYWVLSFPIWSSLFPESLGWSVRSILNISITGIIVGVTQWAVIRRYIIDARWWVIATISGYVFSAAFFLSNKIDFGWLLENQAFNSIFESLFGNHPDYNLSMLVNPSYDFVGEVTMKLLMVVVISFFQWALFLRWFERTGCWVLITVVSMAISIYLYTMPGWLIFAIINGIGLSYLLDIIGNSKIGAC